ncbi:MAG: diguanylate cyclase, partial [Nitrospinae bacterium]|nr:diguanylate cyclase [Nitrospinota bacterium]
TAHTLARRRGRESVLQAALDQNQIDRATLDAMMDSIREAFPVFRRYLASKAEKLGKKQLAWWDLAAPMGSADKVFTWREARDFIVEKFSAFDESLGQFAAGAFDNNWIDGEPPEFQHMMKWCRFLCEAPHRKALSERFLHIPRNLIQCDAIAVVWFESGGPGRITHSKGWRQSLKSLTVESGVAISGACFESGQPLLVPNTMKQPWIIFSEDESPESFGAIMAAPIANEKRMLGLVVCATHAANGLQQTELNKLTLMTAFTASALGQMNPQPPAELIPKPEEQAAPASQYFMPVHVKAFEAEIIKRDTPVSVLSIRIKNGKTLFNGNRQVQADRLLDQIAIHLSNKVKLLKLFIKRSEEGLILLLIGIIEEQACELEDSIQHELSRLPFTLGKTPVEVEFDYGLASSPSDGRDLKQLIEASWTRTRQPRENAHG